MLCIDSSSITEERSPKESPHNQYLRLEIKGRYIDKRRDI